MTEGKKDRRKDRRRYWKGFHRRRPFWWKIVTVHAHRLKALLVTFSPSKAVLVEGLKALLVNVFTVKGRFGGRIEGVIGNVFTVEGRSWGGVRKLRYVCAGECECNPLHGAMRHKKHNNTKIRHVSRRHAIYDAGLQQYIRVKSPK